MFYTVNHTTHSLHTVKPGTTLEESLLSKTIGERLTIRVGDDRHSVFETPGEARDFLALLELDGGQQ